MASAFSHWAILSAWENDFLKKDADLGYFDKCVYSIVLEIKSKVLHARQVLQQLVYFPSLK